MCPGRDRALTQLGQQTGVLGEARFAALRFTEPRLPQSVARRLGLASTVRTRPTEEELVKWNVRLVAFNLEVG